MNMKTEAEFFATVLVYKTDVADKSEAKMIIQAIHRHFPKSDVSFDLEDCDNVLRVESRNGKIDERKIIRLVEDQGFQLHTLL